MRCVTRLFHDIQSPGKRAGTKSVDILPRIDMKADVDIPGTQIRCSMDLAE